MVEKDVLLSLGGALIGSLLEEGVEAVFPGVGELGLTGELAGGIVALLGSRLSKDEARAAIESFIRFAYKKVNLSRMASSPSDEEIGLFTANFHRLPAARKRAILVEFRNAAPYEYGFLVEFLGELADA